MAKAKLEVRDCNFINDTKPFPVLQTWVHPTSSQRMRDNTDTSEKDSRKPSVDETTLTLEKHADRIAALVAQKRKENEASSFRLRLLRKQLAHKGEVDPEEEKLAYSYGKLKRKMEASAHNIHDLSESDDEEKKDNPVEKSLLVSDQQIRRTGSTNVHNEADIAVPRRTPLMPCDDSLRPLPGGGANLDESIPHMPIVEETNAATSRQNSSMLQRSISTSDYHHEGMMRTEVAKTIQSHPLSYGLEAPVQWPTFTSREYQTQKTTVGSDPGPIHNTYTPNNDSSTTQVLNSRWQIGVDNRYVGFASSTSLQRSVENSTNLYENENTHSQPILSRNNKKGSKTYRRQLQQQQNMFSTSTTTQVHPFAVLGSSTTSMNNKTVGLGLHQTLVSNSLSQNPVNQMLQPPVLSSNMNMFTGHARETVLGTGTTITGQTRKNMFRN